MLDFTFVDEDFAWENVDDWGFWQGTGLVRRLESGGQDWLCLNDLKGLIWLNERFDDPKSSVRVDHVF